jgi:hypothetical protein
MMQKNIEGNVRVDIANTHCVVAYFVNLLWNEV